METSWAETERRQHERYPLMLEAAVTIGVESFAAVIFYISAGGAKVHLKDAWNAAENAMPKTAVLEIPEYGDFKGDIVWTDDEYIGRMVWNRLRYIKNPDTGKRVSKLNDPDQWIIHDVPDLRIVAQEFVA